MLCECVEDSNCVMSIGYYKFMGISSHHLILSHLPKESVRYEGYGMKDSFFCTTQANHSYNDEQMGKKVELKIRRAREH